ncbi:MAG: hypothetical protein MSC43_03045 [Clostridiales bacterium]|nr:hypothetical protein [Clostridiales bacterium]
MPKLIEKEKAKQEYNTIKVGATIPPLLFYHLTDSQEQVSAPTILLNTGNSETQ